MPRAGDSIGPYTLTQKLGQGAFGAVWLAERRTAITTTMVALKTSLDDDVDLETIKQEANLWVQASGHPNVVPIIEADVYDGRVVIVSEYAPGGTLADRLASLQGEPMPLDTAVEMILGTLAGLEHLHLKSIIHRDLKPANILIQGDAPRLTDFGISRILKTTSQSSSIAGTPVYMAPETFEGKRSSQADLWSVGVIFYELLTGRLPYPQTDLNALLGAILTREPEPLPSSVPNAIRNVVGRALQKDLTKRFQSATEMRQALRSAMQIVHSGGDIAATRAIASNTVPATVFAPAPPVSEPPRKGGAALYVIAGATLVIIILILGGLFVLFRPGRRGRLINNEGARGSTNTAQSLQRNEGGVTARPGSGTNSSASTDSPKSNATFQSNEAKILTGSLLSPADIAGFSQLDLKLLRNTVYARHGRPFQAVELRQYFEGRPWYSRNNNYSDADLTSDDKANITLIHKAEKE